MVQRSLLAQLRLGLLARGDVAADGEVLPRLAEAVEEGDDGRVDPVKRSVLRFVTDDDGRPIRG